MSPKDAQSEDSRTHYSDAARWTVSTVSTDGGGDKRLPAGEQLLAQGEGSLELRFWNVAGGGVDDLPTRRSSSRLSNKQEKQR